MSALPQLRRSGISIHALRKEGDRRRGHRPRHLHAISIHALRKEGDRGHRSAFHCVSDFYPRPPQGGRRDDIERLIRREGFLSTPSARRATAGKNKFEAGSNISIHALRKEGDRQQAAGNQPIERFLSTPSARRATRPQRQPARGYPISIHALRKEGDPEQQLVAVDDVISIHALRKEGDPCGLLRLLPFGYFYPRPPQGGRPRTSRSLGSYTLFLSTPSARRATAKTEKNISAFVSL